MTNAEPAAVVSVDALSRSFPGPPSVVALQPASFTIASGELVAIMGPSGSGKTTLLSLLGLLDEPTTGGYRLAGVDVANLSHSERAGMRAHTIGFVFQAFHLVGYRTAVENVELGLTYQGLPRRVRRERAREAINEVGLGSRADALCSNLSGGEKQRVAIARALVRRPVLILCDEPTGNLDSDTSLQVLGLLDLLHQRGLTIVVVTHDQSVGSQAQRILLIRDGRVSAASEQLL